MITDHDKTDNNNSGFLYSAWVCQNWHGAPQEPSIYNASCIYIVSWFLFVIPLRINPCQHYTRLCSTDLFNLYLFHAQVLSGGFLKVPQKDDGTLRKRKVFSLNLNPEERKKTIGKLKGDEWVHQTSRFLKWKQTSYTPENKSLWERRKRWGIERAGEKCGGRGLGRRRMEERDKFKWTLTETNCFCQTLSRFLGLWLKFDVECWDIVKKKIKIWERKMENFFNALIGPLRTVILFVIGNVNIAKE